MRASGREGGLAGIESPDGTVGCGNGTAVRANDSAVCRDDSAVRSFLAQGETFLGGQD